MIAPDRDEQAIRERAYRLWEAEGKPEGREDEFWQRACSDQDEAEDRLVPRGPPNEQTSQSLKNS